MTDHLVARANLLIHIQGQSVEISVAEVCDACERLLALPNWRVLAIAFARLKYRRRSKRLQRCIARLQATMEAKRLAPEAREYEPPELRDSDIDPHELADEERSAVDDTTADTPSKDANDALVRLVIDKMLSLQIDRLLRMSVTEPETTCDRSLA